MKTVAKGGINMGSGMIANSGVSNSVQASTIYGVECIRNGEIVWKEEFHNRVVTAGLNKLLDSTFKTGVTTPTWFVGLKGGAGGDVAGDTMNSHTGWTEITGYTGLRKAFDIGAATIANGSVSNFATKASFVITSASTVHGCFLCDDESSNAVSVTLYGVGDFTASRAVEVDDVLNVTVTLTQSNAV